MGASNAILGKHCRSDFMPSSPSKALVVMVAVIEPILSTHAGCGSNMCVAYILTESCYATKE